MFDWDNVCITAGCHAGAVKYVLLIGGYDYIVSLDLELDRVDRVGIYCVGIDSNLYQFYTIRRHWSDVIMSEQ